MNMTNYIFDLYGTLVDIHTNESKASLWKNMAQIFSMMGAAYTAPELKMRYKELAEAELQKRLHRAREEFHDSSLAAADIEIQLENVFCGLLADKGIDIDERMMAQTGIAFRSLSLSYIRLYEGVPELLQNIHEGGDKSYLLSNAQRLFTEPEMRMLGIYDSFDGILYSSDVGVKKPCSYFYDALFRKYGLDKEESVMIGNEYRADILGAAEYGLGSIYIYTAQSGMRPQELPENCREIKKIAEVLLDKT